MSKQTLGGWSESRPATAEDQVICDSVKAVVEAELDRTFPAFTDVTVRTQVVQGVNYLMKIKVASGEFLHALIYQDLKADPKLIAVKFPKKEDDPLEPFGK